MIPKIIFANSICVSLIFIIITTLTITFSLNEYEVNTNNLFHDNNKKEISIRDKVNIKKLLLIYIIAIISSFIVYTTVYYCFDLYKFFKN